MSCRALAFAIVVIESAALSGCGEEGAAGVELGVTLGPDRSAVVAQGPSAAVPNTPPGPGPCLTVACCEKQLPPVTDPCLEVAIENQKCVTRPRSEGAACAGPSVCGGTPRCLAGKCTVPSSAWSCTLPVGPCDQAMCDEASGTCVSKPKADGSACPDGDVCNGDEVCQLGKCLGGKALDCADADSCTKDTCHAKGGCQHDVLPDGSACDDGDQCLAGESCTKGVCGGGAILSCNDGNACTLDGCKPASGCAHAPVSGTPCSDLDACTSLDVCDAGVCKGTSKLDCNDANVCTSDACDPKSGCTYATAVGPCDDGNACTQDDACSGVQCVPGKNTCGCSATSPCPDDGDACNGKLQCVQGSCVVDPATVPACDDVDVGPCHVAQCDKSTGTCATVKVSDGTACDDGQACTLLDQCTGGSCGGTPKVCDDGDACTANACEAKDGCVFTPAPGGPCDDGDACTSADTCGNTGCHGTAVVCPSGGPCMTTACQKATGCQSTPKTGSCDDANKCTTSDTCVGGHCKGTAKVCGGGDACNVPVCELATGSCITEAPVCDDGDACTDDACAPATGCVTTPASCADAEPCTVDGCDPKSGCTHVANACDDSDACTDDACVTGQGCAHLPATCNDGSACTTDSCTAPTGCIFAPIVCADTNPCTVDGCEPSQGCVFPAKSCDDGVGCTADACKDGVCDHAPQASACNDDNPCTNDGCDAVADCTHTPNVLACDDGDAETVADVCAAGVCAGFVATVGSPSGALGQTWLDHIGVSDGEIVATGGDSGITGVRAFLVTLGATGPAASTVVPASVLVSDRYVALGDRVAVTATGRLLTQDDDGVWAFGSALDDAFSTFPEAAGTTAAHAAPAAPGQPLTPLFLAGRTNGASWIVHCARTSNTCAKLGIAWPSFAESEQPRAMSSWMGATGGAQAMLVADFAVGALGWSSDAFAFPTQSGTDFGVSYFDQASGPSRSRDVASVAGSPVWWAGTRGLLRARTTTAGKSEWTVVTTAATSQSQVDFQGVGMDADTAVLAGVRAGAIQTTATVWLHATGSAPSQGWTEHGLVTTATVSCVAACLPIDGSGAFGTTGTPSAAAMDVVLYDGLTVVVGYAPSATPGVTSSLIAVR